MLKEWKSKRQLSLFVALALSAGGGGLLSDFQYAYAADVTGGDVVVDAGHPAPTPVAAGNAHDIPGATDNRNVTGNKLTLATVNAGRVFGGYTDGTGNVTGNEVIIKNGAYNSSFPYDVFGGWSDQGNATNNKITLSGAGSSSSYNHLYGGYSYNSGADVITGNTLNVVTKDNWVASLSNFEKMNFKLGTGISSGDTMLNVIVSGYATSYDWNNITVEDAANWVSGITESKRVKLYSGPSLTFNNYSLSGTTSGDFEYGLDTNTTTPSASSVQASEIYFDVEKFRNAEKTVTASGWGILYAGRSKLGNTTTNNTLTLTNGLTWTSSNIYAGYTVGAGDSDGNHLILKDDIYVDNSYVAYGGWSATGKAINNKVTISNVTSNAYATVVSGGGSGDPSAEVTKGNTLEIQKKNNRLYSIYNFEKMSFDLASGVPSGSYMLHVVHSTGSAFDWKNITVSGLSTWAAEQAAANNNTPALTLYTGGWITLNNYQPSILGTAGDYEFGKHSDASGTGTVTATSVTLSGTRFQNAGIGQNVTTPGATPRDTYAGLSVYGNTTNHNELNLTGGSHTNARAGYTDAQNGGSDFNTLNLLPGGSVTSGYAGYTTGVHLLADPTNEEHPELVDTTKDADAKNNTVNIKGGTLNAGGKLVGGYIATNTALSATSAGNASGNTINIEEGTFGGNTEIYGGYTEGTGKATGNTVNIGTSAGALTASTLSNTMLYGGGSSGSASDVVTDNKLNVNTNASVRNIKNFGKVSFNFTSTFNQANPMLNVVGGAATDLDWAAVTYTGTAPTGRSVLMQNTSNINLGGTYTGAKLASLTDTHERVIDTNTGTGTATQIYLDGFQFKSANVTPTTGSATEDVWAGRSVIGNTTTENTLTINGTTHRDAYGGWTAGTGTTKAAKNDSTVNTVNLKAGSSVRNIYGGFTSVQSGNATGNKVNISGGSVSGTVHGGYLSHASATGDATGNTVTITGGTMGDVYGGWTAGTGATTGNTVNLGSAADAVASGTTIGKIYGGNKSAAADNTLNVYDSVTAGNIANFDKVNFKATSTHIAAGALGRVIFSA